MGTANEGHWAGTIAAPVTYVIDSAGKVKWAYVSESASDRPGPVVKALGRVAHTSSKRGRSVLGLTDDKTFEDRVGAA